MNRNSISNYEIGWVASSIHRFFEAVESVPASMAWCLVTGLDSSRRIATIWKSSEHLAGIRDEGRAVGAGVIIPTRVLAAADQTQKLFFGFDEVWFSPKGNLTEKPDALSLVAPRPVTRESLEPYQEWLHENEISLGLGDGGGMNYCAKLTGIAKLLSRASERSATADEYTIEYEPADPMGAVNQQETSVV